MYREKPTAKWVGPFVVRGVKEKVITLDSGYRLVRASVDKVKGFKEK